MKTVTGGAQQARRRDESPTTGIGTTLTNAVKIDMRY